ncbi:FAD-dependent oxidoreductase [Aquimarina addita]|uniref:FAD-dependent oxidoreductase n=1 Tax=Aquimarina addita TaxID=870485 RepID=A0ABP6UMJ3_9FLAO
MLDYMIVGFGLAGLSFAEQLETNKKSYIVFEDASQKSSRVAGGLFNPVILKRFTAAWRATEQLDAAILFYTALERKLNQSFIHKFPILRRFNSIEEQNTWFQACDKPILNKFLSFDIVKNTYVGLDIPFHFGKVNHTGRIDITKMLAAYSKHLIEHQQLITTSFIHDKLRIEDTYVEYEGIKAKNVIFTEGFGMINNPFFEYLPLRGNKGEYVLIKCHQLDLKEAIKSSIFIIPLGDNIYKVGATYNNKDSTANHTQSAKEELIEKLDTFLKFPYEIVDQVAGIRPTTKDRKPFIGTHPEYANMHLLNGLGSRGVLIGPYVAKKLFEYLEYQQPLDREIDIQRFE